MDLDREAAQTSCRSGTAIRVVSTASRRVRLQVLLQAGCPPRGREAKREAAAEGLLVVGLPEAQRRRVEAPLAPTRKIPLVPAGLILLEMAGTHLGLAPMGAQEAREQVARTVVEEGLVQEETTPVKQDRVVVTTILAPRVFLVAVEAR